MRYEEILERANGAQIIAVSKYVDSAAVRILASLGQIEFGENRVQELIKKRAELSDLSALKWHFIGRLQSNKINQMIAQKPVLWQSCESISSAMAVEKRLAAMAKSVSTGDADGGFYLDCLLQINSANEPSKQGFSLDEVIDAWAQITSECRFLRPVGVMSIGAHSEDLKTVQKSFEATRSIFERLNGAKICSMGMSGDFELAIKCGSNMVRLGSILFA